MTERESRIKKTLLNARVNFIYYFITLILSFFSRKVFLDCLGADFVGLTGTLQNLLGFLNLAELGVGSAIGYLLYKPLYDHDQDKINEIISVMGYLYRIIGLVILVAGCILACFLPLIYPNTDFGMGIIVFAYFTFLASTLIGYFINYRQNLLGADQRNYVVTAYFQTATVVKTILQMVSAYYTGSYYLWMVIELVFGIGYSFILNWKIDQTYPWLKAEVKLGKKLFKKYPEVMQKTKQLFIHQISGFVQFQTTPFLTYAFVSLKIVAYYGNYTLLVDKIIQLMNTFLSSINASVGNLIAEGNKQKIMDVFYENCSLRYLYASFITFVIYLFLEPFITVWLGGEYLLGHVVLVLLCLKMYVQVMAGKTYAFIYGYGLFADVWAAIVQSAIFLVVAILGGYYYGLSGIIVASIISYFVIQSLWKPYYLFKKGFMESLLPYVTYSIGMNVINIIAILLPTYIMQQLFPIKNTSFSSIIVSFIFTMAVYLIITLILYLSLSKSSRRLLRRLAISISLKNKL